jgi:hypothetical protein
LIEVVADRYAIVAPLGGGGTSLVYRARPTRGGLDVALKMLRPQFATDNALRRRFLREAELARALDHACIVRVLDTGVDRGTPFLVLELVEAETLRQRLDRSGRFDPRSAAAVFVALARALDHAHGRGVIHRDVSPQNVFVDRWTVKLADFGNARVVSLASVTGASLTWGKPEYAAPELFGRGRADPRSDLYALGVIFYEMLTGRVPWTRAEALTRIAGGSCSPPASTGAGEGIDSLVRDLLAPSATDRPASAAEALARITEPDAGTAVVVAKSRCASCGAAGPEDVPRCPSCGTEILRLRHDPAGRWRVVLRRLADDAAATESLLRLLEPITKRLDIRLLFLTGDPGLYSDQELKEGVALPAVLLSDLDRESAHQLASLCRGGGLDVEVIEGTAERLLRTATPRSTPWRFASVGVLGAVLVGFRVHSLFWGLATGVSWGALALLGWSRRRLLRETKGLFELRDEIAVVPAADGMLARALEAAREVRAPEVRALFSDVACELYRLSRRAQQMGARAEVPSGEGDLVARTLAAAPAVCGRLRQVAARLDALDDQLAGTNEGELMQAIARQERAATAPSADRVALAAARRDLEETLERRAAAEQQRARLAAALCGILGRLRQVYRRASVLAVEEPETRALEAASAELDAFLSTSEPSEGSEPPAMGSPEQSSGSPDAIRSAHSGRASPITR